MEYPSKTLTSAYNLTWQIGQGSNEIKYYSDPVLHGVGCVFVYIPNLCAVTAWLHLTSYCRHDLGIIISLPVVTVDVLCVKIHIGISTGNTVSEGK